ncbi:metal ABC transporter permease [Dactylosporangium matsuzakiense]|uniref:Membrane protein n=1 Tax=Dactylosporangium matsuzakiense TaxID=53360 RepID=A0A9W6NLC5_9ACTN|nr:metal ABC transporter permease [Dactylosporangium matsuzakiense]GLL00973.1 membrane protein [Dactylosporangium matsuzakiense]
MYDLFIAPFTLPFMARALLELLLLAVLAGVVSAHVLTRRLGFVADTMTHTVFPGVVLGFVTAGVDGIFPGALLAAAVTALLLTLFTRSRRVTDDTALAVLLAAMFAVGVVLVSRRASYTADLTALLFGRLLTVNRAEIIQTALVAAIVLVALALLHKELVLRAFDPAAASAMGYRIWRLDLVLNLAVALVVVAAARSVGTMLVIALLVVPAATGRVLSARLPAITAIGVAVAAVGGALGLTISYHASITYGLRLAGGATVVLTLVAAHLLTLTAAALARAARSRPRRRAPSAVA